VKISNLLRVLSSEHAADPTQIEARVKAEMEQRKLQHVARNLALKLTPKEKAEKLRRRVQQDANTSSQVVFCLYVWDA
jgi:U4/U6 small nuclear ribonucleoprotein PRP3